MLDDSRTYASPSMKKKNGVALSRFLRRFCLLCSDGSLHHAASSVSLENKVSRISCPNAEHSLSAICSRMRRSVAGGAKDSPREHCR